MTDTTDSLEEINEELLEEHLDQLQDCLETLEPKLEGSEMRKIEHHIEVINETASQIIVNYQSVQASLTAMDQRLEKFEEEQIDKYGGGPSKEAKEKFFEATGWHPDES